MLDCVDRSVTCEVLVEPFTGDEIWNVLDSIGNLKAPGADGMPIFFIRNFGL